MTLATPVPGAVSNAMVERFRFHTHDGTQAIQMHVDETFVRYADYERLSAPTGDSGALREALERIREDDEQESHPCGPQRYGHFGSIAHAALSKGEPGK